MLNIMKADFYRFVKSKIWLKIILGFTIFLLLGNIVSAVGQGNGEVTLVADIKNQNEVNFATNGSLIMLQLLRGSNFLFYFLIPIVLYTLISDFKWKTLKNELSFRYSRNEYYFAKCLFATIIAALLPIFYTLYGLLFNQLFNGFSGSIHLRDFIEMLKIVALQFPIYLGFTSLLLLIGIIFQSNAIVVGVVLTYQLGIFFIFSMVRSDFFGNIEPITCLNSAAFLQQLSTTEIITIILVGLAMAAISLPLGLLTFKRKAIQ